MTQEDEAEGTPSTHAWRAVDARSVLTDYTRRRDGRDFTELSTDDEFHVVVDFIIDLMHFARLRSLPLDKAFGTARDRFKEELRSR